MAKPSYGGWVSFTVHLAKNMDVLYTKLGKEQKNLRMVI